jgi:hypothetical protein
MSDHYATAADLSAGAIIRLGRYKNALAVTNRTSFEETGRVMVGLEFVKNPNQTEKSLMLDPRNESVAVHVGMTTVESVSSIEVVGEDREAVEACGECGRLIPAGWFETCEECTPEADAEEQRDAGEQAHFDPDAETVTDAWEGAFIHESWGYGQTNNDFAQIVEVSDTGKTVLARLVRAEAVDEHKTSRSVRPTADQYGEEFRLHVRAPGGDPAFRGSYPYIDGDSDNGTRKGHFRPFGDTAGKTVPETRSGCGH